MATSILIVDDEKNVIESFRLFLENEYNLLSATSGEEALEIVREENVDIALLDIMLPGMDGIETLRHIKSINEDIDVIMITALNTVRTAIEAMKAGAYDYITKPFEIEEVLASIEKVVQKRRLIQEVNYFRQEVAHPVWFNNIVGESKQMKEIYRIIEDVSHNSTTVLITGESGTGKELIARAIHFNGPRKDMPFVALDSASIPDNLVESELFGYEKGAFTGATEKKIGKFELSQNGTLFLDEIGNLKFDIQGKLLRVIQEKEIQRLGGIRDIKVDARIIAATNMDLKQGIREGRFREDLYYRLNVVPIHIPPLREKKTDIPLFVKHFLDAYNKEFNKKVPGFTDQAMEYLLGYHWPGNVRELKNIIERLIALSKNDEIISHKRLPLDILLNKGSRDLKDNISFKNAKDQFERQYILSVLEKAKWNQTKAAKILGIHRNTLLLKIQQLNLKNNKFL